MTQAARRRRTDQQSSGLLGLLVTISIVFGGLFYGYRTLITGDFFWFSSAFNAQPRHLAIIDRGERTEIDPSDPLFHELTEALNRSISQGYRFSGVGLSDVTWNVVERNGVMVEATYAEPVQLRGGIEPTTQLLLLIGGENIWIEQALFRSYGGNWNRNPLLVTTIDPIREILEREGIETPVDPG